MWIDLGDVKNLAIVTVNGKELGQIWHTPYRMEVTSALKPGANQITVKVVNAWVNRMIGDEQPGATKITFADVKPYKANSPLLPSGLLGPVTVVAEKKVQPKAESGSSQSRADGNALFRSGASWGSTLNR